MDVNITGRNLDLDAPLKKYIHKKLGKIERLYNRIYRCEIILEEEKSRKNAEVILHLKSSRVVAKESSLDMYASIDGASFKIKKQLKKLNGRLSSRRRKAVLNKIMRPVPYFGNKEETAVPEEVEIIKMNAFADKPMLPGEARLELALTERNFIMFKNADTGEVNVLYKRNDGRCGLIEPDF